MTKPFIHPKIEFLATSCLWENPDNVKTHGPRQITQLAAAIARFGWLVPIVCDADLMILAGHARWLAAKKLKLDKVPVIRADHLSEVDKAAFALGENRLAQLSGIDEKKLQKEIDRLFNANFNLETIGYSTADLTFKLVDNGQEVQPPENFVTADIAVSRIGDCWAFYPAGVAPIAANFGKAHRLLCSDSLVVESLETLMRGQKADLVFDDPPYNVKVNGHVRGGGRGGKTQFREFAMASGEMTAPEFMGFLRPVFRNCVRFSKDGSLHFHFQDWRHIREMLDAADGVYTEFKQLICWDKGVGGQGTFYRSQYELIFVFKSGKAKHTNNFQLGQHGRYRTNLWSGYPGVNTFRKGRKEDLEAHATPKPIALIIDAIRDCSNPGEIVMDAFCGSGTTIIAAHKAGRIGVGIEIDPLYVDVAIRRIAAATGLVPILDGDGRTFDEVAAARLSETGD